METELIHEEEKKEKIHVKDDTTNVCLKGAEEVAEEGVLHPQGQDLPLNHGTLDVIILQHSVLLQRL